MAAHLKFEEREVLYRLSQKDTPQKDIAEALGRHRTTVWREKKRNSGQRGYRPKQAQRLAEARRENSRRSCKLADPQTHQYVQKRLEDGWSPDQIASRSRQDFSRQPRRFVSRQTIYDWIDRQEPAWQPLLRRGGRPPEKRGRLTDCVRIDGRPDVINHRRRYGDWEGDTIVGKGRRSALLTLVERKSGYLRLAKLDSLKSLEAIRMVERRLAKLPEPLRRSATFDNGKEFADHQRLAKRRALSVYFADPYKSWQRGTNENTNGLLRQYFPKGTDFTGISHQEVARVEKLLNERPRRRLGYRTPSEVLAKRLCCN
jgi:transposase, IS30 family